MVMRGLCATVVIAFSCYAAYALVFGPIAAACQFKNSGWQGIPKLLRSFYPDVPWVPAPFRGPYDVYLTWWIY
jgi:hypothetical protein